MNLRGSYRALLNNSKAALIAAIEIYNKPQIQYRDETFTVLLINAWELLLKAILSKNKQRIYYIKKHKNESYKTYSLDEALRRVRGYFPVQIEFEPVKQNIEAIEEYRDNTIHFYNEVGFGVLVYGLAQTSIINYRDLVNVIFGVDIASEMTLHLLPLAFGIPPDPITFLQTSAKTQSKKRRVSEYLSRISRTTRELEQNSVDTGRFLTVFTVSLQSVKKVSSADMTVAIDNESYNITSPIVHTKMDPNQSHPLRESDIIHEIGEELNGTKFNTYIFRAIVWKYELKAKKMYCWTSDVLNGSPQYSRDVIPFLRNLTKQQIETVREDYSAHWKRNRKSKFAQKGKGVLT